MTFQSSSLWSLSTRSCRGAELSWVTNEQCRCFRYQSKAQLSISAEQQSMCYFPKSQRYCRFSV